MQQNGNRNQNQFYPSRNVQNQIPDIVRQQIQHAQAQHQFQVSSSFFIFQSQIRPFSKCNKLNFWPSNISLFNSSKWACIPFQLGWAKFSKLLGSVEVRGVHSAHQRSNFFVSANQRRARPPSSNNPPNIPSFCPPYLSRRNDGPASLHYGTREPNPLAEYAVSRKVIAH